MRDGPLKAQYTIEWGGIGLIFLITGLSISTEALVKQAKNYRLHLVTQILSFLVFSAVVCAIVAIIRASGTHKIDTTVLAGLILMSILPTTVNIVVTQNAGGNVEAATIEVCIGNTVGTFITPLLLSMYLQKRDGWGFILPKAQGGDGLIAIYKHMAQQLSAILFAPLIVGQFVQNFCMAWTKYWRERLHLNIVGQVLLLIVIWSTFCNKFASGAFKAITHQSVILICFLGVALYAVLTGLCLLATRVPFAGQDGDKGPRWKAILRNQRFGKRESAAVCFCVTAKGLVLGAPLVSIMYGGYSLETQAIMSTPIALYQTTQILLAQLSVGLFKCWIEAEEEDDRDTLSHQPPDLEQNLDEPGGVLKNLEVYDCLMVMFEDVLYNIEFLCYLRAASRAIGDHSTIPHRALEMGPSVTPFVLYDFAHPFPMNHWLSEL
ncbi:hypothetical protein FRB94_005247 [Tulasnella sp. JGI-2019a]|nr:hypothetical protein FRB94_005247 [Tulasnella sp. JGI-2019a]